MHWQGDVNLCEKEEERYDEQRYGDEDISKAFVSQPMNSRLFFDR